jgi:hypothetical protein
VDEQAQQPAQQQQPRARGTALLQELLALLDGDEAKLRTFMQSSVAFNRGALAVDDYDDCVVSTFRSEHVALVLPRLMKELARKNRELALALRDVYLAKHQ